VRITNFTDIFSLLNTKWVISASFILFFLLCVVFVGPVMSKVDLPNYTVISSAEEIEIRQYAPMIIAEVEVQGDRKAAINSGFRLLADYIFGNNIIQKDIAMTAPVQQEANQKIAMTAPVQQQAHNNAWKVSFVMPAEYSMATLPKPNNPRVVLIQIPEKRVVAIRFSGFHSAKNIATHQKALQHYIDTHHINVVGTPKYAFYNPPWTLPFMRRNEVMLEIAN
jgi:effector-binding domain-containing protein